MASVPAGDLPEEVLDRADHFLGALQILLQLHSLCPQLLVFSPQVASLPANRLVLSDEVRGEFLEYYEVGLEELEVGEGRGKQLSDSEISDRHPNNYRVD